MSDNNCSNKSMLSQSALLMLTAGVAQSCLFDSIGLIYLLNRTLLNMKISQNSVAMHFRCGWIFSYLV